MAHPEKPFLLRVDSLAAGGAGVGRAPDGRAVFVPFAAPGDRVRVRVVEERPRFLRARVEALLEASPLRVPPACHVFGSCGGCQWQHVAPEAQLEAKRQILAAAFARIARLPLEEPPEVVPSPLAYGYRRRARLYVSGGRVGFRRARSHALCATARCPVLAPELDAALRRLSLQTPRPRDGEWELAVGRAGRVRVAPLPPGGFPCDPIEVALGEDLLEISAGVFVQAHTMLLEPLCRAVWSAAGKGRRALELFAGAGALTLGLARRFARVTAVEAHPAAVRDLRRNLARAEIHNVHVARARAEHVLRHATSQRPAPDAVVVDPPREGLAPQARASLARLRAGRLVYVSCNPATLARDVAALTASGWRLRCVRGFDLFPQTAHLEAVALLERSAARFRA